jgi:hypothetical protein
MIETKTRKIVSAATNIFRALRLGSTFGKPSDSDEDTRLDLQAYREDFNAFERVAREKALLDAEYAKAEAMTNLKRQKFT